ncbi:MAG TPA: helix-hairpin-helix domain-containing protein [Rhodothermales bacterium]|nr:helix-hairpin-helix domain-containing protein [Rhodothermales bacterium]
MTNKQIARILKETGSLVELTGGNTFRARAFENAGRTLERVDVSIAELAASGELTDLKGIGDGLAAQIKEILRRGSFDVRDDLLSQVPPGVLELLRIKGLGAKKVHLLWRGLDVTSLEELEHAARSGRLASVEGFGAKSQQKLIDQLELHRKYRGRRRYAEAYSFAQPVLEALRGFDAVEAADLAGEMRRLMDTVSAVELIASSAGADAVEKALTAASVPVSLIREGDETVLDGTVGDDFPLRIYVAAPERYGTILWYRTGSQAHVDTFLDAYGEPKQTADEHDVYAGAGIQYVLPELREGSGELEAAARNELPDLIDDGDFKGTLHNHTNYSDGANTLSEMADGARALGLSYFGLCDHSRSLAIANGLSVERVREQQAEVRRLNESYASQQVRFRIFSGTECDVLADGSLDYPDDVLATFDFVVASIHQGFNMSEEEGTQRLLRAIENPYTTILGHATGRLLLAREGYPIDHERIIEACAANEVAIEINANPYRLDMDWRWIRRATEQGVMISINPDAHSVPDLANTHWGMLVARKAWLTPEQCLNAMPLETFEDWLNTRRANRKP